MQVRRELAAGGFTPLARIADNAYLLAGPDLRADLQGALLFHVSVVEEVPCLDRPSVVGSLGHHRVAAQPVPAVLVRALHRDDGAVGDRDLRRPGKAMRSVPS